MGAVYALVGRSADGVSLLLQGLESRFAKDMAVEQAPCRLTLAEAQALAGRLEEARDLAERVLVLACEHQERGREAYALRLLGDIAAQDDPTASSLAERHYRQALDLVAELGMAPLRAHCHLGLGTLFAKMRQPALARVNLATAIDLYRALDMTFWLPQAETALAQVEER